MPDPASLHRIITTLRGTAPEPADQAEAKTTEPPFLLGRSKPQSAAASTDRIESCSRSLRQHLDTLTARNGRAPVFDALAGLLVVEARAIGEAGRVVCELESVCAELRAGVTPGVRRGYVGTGYGPRVR